MQFQSRLLYFVNQVRDGGRDFYTALTILCPGHILARTDYGRYNTKKLLDESCYYAEYRA